MQANVISGTLILGLLFTLRAFAEGSPEAALDSLHRAGAAANPVEFIGMLAPEAVFLGVDGSARLQGQSLRDYVSESFASGNAWDYSSSEREMRLSSDGAIAWFDECLQHHQRGSGRGTGVLIYSGGAWKIAQYNLTIPLPGAAVSGAQSSGPPAVTEAPQKPECRKIRHKTNKQASC